MHLPNALTYTRSPVDTIEYKGTKSKHGNQRAFIEVRDDSRSTQRIVPDNNTVLSEKGTTCKRVKLFDTEARRHIPYPIAEWHNLKDCMLQPGVF